jgi:hypothetical protein
MSTHFDHRMYPVVDAAEKESCRPDFAVAIYPGHLWISEKFELKPEYSCHPRHAAYILAAGRE